MLTTRELLTETLERLFGKVTVRVNRFEGRGREPLGFSANYFCNECLRARGDTNPINGMARDRVIDMSRRVLAGKADYDVWQFSNAVSELLFDLFGVETAEFAIDSEGDALRTKKAFAQAALLSRMLRMAEGKAKVDEAAVARALERTAETRRRALGGFGPERFYESAPFPLTSGGGNVFPYPQTLYATPRLLLYCIGLMPPSDLLILFSLYQRMYRSISSMKPSIVTPSQSTPRNASTFSLPKNPSIAELSGLHPFFDIDLATPARSHIDIHSGQR